MAVDLASLRNDIERAVEDLRMKTKGASSEAQHLLESLEVEVKRFAQDVVDVADDSREQLRDAGIDLRMRLQKLANQVALPS